MCAEFRLMSQHAVVVGRYPGETRHSQMDNWQYTRKVNDSPPVFSHRVRTTFSGALRPIGFSCSTNPPIMGHTLPH